MNRLSLGKRIRVFMYCPSSYFTRNAIGISLLLGTKSAVSARFDCQIWLRSEASVSVLSQKAYFLRT